MSAANDNTRQWNRGCLDEWRAGHSEERKDADQKLLSRIFALAAGVPQLKEALDWANAHGVEFVVDRTAKVNGYYNGGTGVVALSANILKDPAWAVGTVTHEIRHAWQDWYGMLGHRVGRFSDYFTSIVLIEADADTFGMRARKQYALRKQQDSLRSDWEWLWTPKKRLEKLERQIQGMQKDNDVLWSGFKDWFTRGRAASYGPRAMKNLAHELGVPGIPADTINAEFKPFPDDVDIPLGTPKDFSQDDELRRLGRGFSGGNYFNGKGKREELRSIFRPAAAERFYSSRPRPKLMDEITRYALRRKLKKTPDAKPSAAA